MSVSLGEAITVLSPRGHIVRLCVVYSTDGTVIRWEQVDEILRSGFRDVSDEGIEWIRGHHKPDSKESSGDACCTRAEGQSDTRKRV